MSSSKVWFITGASSGFGREATEYALSKGEKVVATLRKPEAIDDLRAQYSTDKLLVIKLDVTRPDEISEAFRKAEDVFGRIDVVYNNAGYAILSELEGTPDEVARAVFETNFWGAANVSREAVKFFRDVNKPIGGRLLNVSSTAGVSALPLLGYYAATKHALEGFTKAFALELDPEWNIKVTIIEYGMFKTGVVNGFVTLDPHPAYSKPTLPTAIMRNVFTPAAFDHSGDPKKAAVKLYELTRLENPPSHLPLGKDSVGEIRKKLASVFAEIDQYESWSDDLAVDKY